MAQGQDEPLKLLLDVPESEALFGFDGYASTLASAILHSEPHFTIGIYGDWGRGKTTLLNTLQSELEARAKDKIVTVFFDAWRYQREEHMLLPLLDTIYEHLKRKRGRWRNLTKTVKRLSKSFAAATSVSPIPQVGIDTGRFREQWEKDARTRSTYYSWLSELQEALSEVRKDDPERRLVIFIDDLDRCLPHTAVEVLESIKVMLDVPGFVFVLALNQEIVERAVEHHYGRDYGIQGRDYLKKLVQLEFRLPPLRPQDVEEYARRLQQRLGQEESEAARALAQVVPMVAEDNPREVKRFINGVMLAIAIARRADQQVLVELQIAFLAVDFRWPDFTRNLSPALLADMKVYIEAKEKGQASEDDEKTRKVTAVLEKNPGLDSFLREPIGNELLNLNPDDLSQLLFYSAITREEAPVEQPRRLTRQQVLDATRRGHSLAGVDLSGTDISRLNLSRMNLSKADLSRTDLSEDNLYRVNLSGAGLISANLSGASLFGTSLSKADLSGADLSRANLYGANFQEARLDNRTMGTLQDTNWREARWDESVRKQLEEMYPEKG